MGNSMRYTIEESMPVALVEYYPEVQVLLIETGQKSAAGEEFASDIIVHYDRDEDDEPSLVVAIQIDSAELLLRPFADKILAKYGVWREPESEQEREERRNGRPLWRRRQNTRFGNRRPPLEWNTAMTETACFSTAGECQRSA